MKFLKVLGLQHNSVVWVLHEMDIGSDSHHSLTEPPACQPILVTLTSSDLSTLCLQIARLLTVVGNCMGQVNVYSCKFIKYCSMVQKAKAMSMKISLVDELTSTQFRMILAKFRNYLQYIINMAVEKRIGIFKVISLSYQSECLPYVENVLHLIHNLLRSVIEKKNTNLLEVSILEILIA